MKYLAAYAMLSLSGKKEINAADIKKVLGDAQVGTDDADINRLLESVKGKKIHDLIAAGTKKIGSSAAPAASSAPVAKEVPQKEAPKKEAAKAKKEAPPPADDEDDGLMAGGLFD